MSIHRVAMVTGGTSPIGQAIVTELARAGHSVSFSYARNRGLAEQLTAATGALAHQADFQDNGWSLDCSAVDILINNAGINISGHPVATTTREEVERSMRVNFITPMLLAQESLPHMIKNEWGRIVNVNSIWGSRGARNRLSYAASKHALRALTVTLALETAALGVTVNEVCPGPVPTPMLAKMGEVAINEGRASSLQDYLASCAQEIPIGRLVSPQAIAALVAFLTSDDASDITGQSLNVSGGCEF